jgi:hypothetical protein
MKPANNSGDQSVNHRFAMSSLRTILVALAAIAGGGRLTSALRRRRRPHLLRQGRLRHWRCCRQRHPHLPGTHLSADRRRPHLGFHLRRIADLSARPCEQHLSPVGHRGVYGAAGATVIRGPQALMLTNQTGAVLELNGNQTGLMMNLDLSGLALSLR